MDWTLNSQLVKVLKEKILAVKWIKGIVVLFKLINLSRFSVGAINHVYLAKLVKCRSICRLLNVLIEQYKCFLGVPSFARWIISCTSVIQSFTRWIISCTSVMQSRTGGVQVCTSAVQSCTRGIKFFIEAFYWWKRWFQTLIQWCKFVFEECRPVPRLCKLLHAV